MLDRFDEIIMRHRQDPSRTIAMLQDIQREFRYLPSAALRRMAEALDVPLSRLYGLATFFRAFTLEPKGKHVITVCMGTACHVRGAAAIVDNLKRDLDVEVGRTTADSLFTLETVNCLGACAVGPVVVVDGEYHGEMSPRKMDRVIQELAKKERKRKRAKGKNS